MTIKSEQWLILAYIFNVDGKAASLTITDRIPLLLKNNISPIVISAITGSKDDRFIHHRIFSCMPSGLQYELRFLLKKSRMQKWLRELLKGLLTLTLLPFYLLERIFIHLDTHWSWGLSSTFQGVISLIRYRPTILYSTAGPSSTHLAGYLLHKISNIPWIAEIHDPLIYDIEKRKWHQRYIFHNWLEKKICTHAAAVIYFTEHALKSADHRHPIQGEKIIIRPGAAPPATPGITYKQKDIIHFGHFGSLAPTRNLSKFIESLHLLIKKQPKLQELIVVDIYGSGLDDISRKALRQFPLPHVLIEHGRLEYDKTTGKTGRRQAIEAMKLSDVLIILHGSGVICEEYIPSKVYEYLLSERPILALTGDSSELAKIIIECDHHVVSPDDTSAIQNAINQYIEKWRNNSLQNNHHHSPYTIERTVTTLLNISQKIQLQ